MSNMFDNEQIAIQQLLNDKHTLLEGYVTEQLFYNQFLSNNSVPFSSGWWMVIHNDVRLFFIVREQISDFERELIAKIPLPHQCWQVYFEDNEFRFVNKEALTQAQFINKFELKKIREPMIATEETRNVTRQENAIDFFKKYRIVKKIATERFFANNFLSVYFRGMINIDFFTKANGKLNLVEVKYKYESRDGCFGINTGQMEMFKYFMSLGFNIYHFILYNHTKDMNISIFGYLDLPGEKSWFNARINDAKSHGTGVAPEMTSVSGSFSQPYIKIPIKEIEDKKIPLIVK